jgi:hypothetical protein
MLGLLLLVTAGMKMQVFLQHSAPAFAVFGSLRLQVAAVACATVLGAWLLVGRKIEWAWTVAFVYFCLLAGASLAMGIQERPSCGCFGKLPVNPWIAFGVDIVALIMLAALPPLRSWVAMRNSLFPGGIGPWLTYAGVAICLLSVASGALAAFGGPTAALRAVRGESITVDRENTIEEGRFGEERYIHIPLTNHSAKPVTIFGGTNECNLRAIRDLPMTIQPGETGSPEVMVFFPREAGVFYRDGVFYSDVAGQTEVPFRVVGKSVGNSD